MHLLVRKILIPTTNFSGIDNKPQDGKPTCNLLHKLWDIGSTPINTSNFDSLLVNYPNKEIATVLSNGFKNGFSLQYTGIRKKVEFKNMISAEEHAVELHEKINKEIKLGRILGPFPCPPISNLRCNPVGILPKKQGGWRMISNLSYPVGNSINDHIDQQYCSVSYSTFDQALSLIQEMGEGALMAKMDISSAFRLLPVCPEDFCLLGFKFLNSYYVDKCLPMGCSISCSLFEMFSSFLHWELQQRSNSRGIIHYLDDFLFIGRANTADCQMLMAHMIKLSKILGIPLAPEKTEGPCTSICFLGLGIDTVSRTIFVPKNKVTELLEKINDALSCKKVTVKKLQSLAGSLAFVVKALPSGRAFCRRVYAALAGGKKSFHFIRISKEIRLDLEMWVEFLTKFNGLTPFPSLTWQDDETLKFYTDSSGSKGCGVIFGSQWCYLAWPSHWFYETTKDITFLELVPIVLGVFIWAEQLYAKKLLLHIDNLSLVHIINQKSSKNNRVMVLIRALVLYTLSYNIQVRAIHVPGKNNNIADAISRFQWSRFRQLAPTADNFPCQIPAPFWEIIHQL